MLWRPPSTFEKKRCAFVRYEKAAVTYTKATGGAFPGPSAFVVVPTRGPFRELILHHSENTGQTACWIVSLRHYHLPLSDRLPQYVYVDQVSPYRQGTRDHRSHNNHVSTRTHEIQQCDARIQNPYESFCIDRPEQPTLVASRSGKCRLPHTTIIPV